jgi:predicted secreted protein
LKSRIYNTIYCAEKLVGKIWYMTIFKVLPMAVKIYLEKIVKQEWGRVSTTEVRTNYKYVSFLYSASSSHVFIAYAELVLL